MTYTTYQKVDLSPSKNTRGKNLIQLDPLGRAISNTGYQKITKDREITEGRRKLHNQTLHYFYSSTDIKVKR
jgi:hypothetical protein